MSKLTIPVCQVCNKQILFNRFGDNNTISLFDDNMNLENIIADNLNNFCSCKIEDKNIKYIKYNNKYNNKISINKEIYSVYRGYFVNIPLNDSNTDYVNCQCGGILIDVVDIFAKNHYIWCEKCGKLHFVNRIEPKELDKYKENKFSLVKDLNDEINNINIESFEKTNNEINILNETDSIKENNEKFSIIFKDDPFKNTLNTFGSWDSVYNNSIELVKLKDMLTNNLDNKYFINNKDIIAYSLLGIELGYHNEIMINIISNTYKTDFDIKSIKDYRFKILNSDSINIKDNNMTRNLDIIVMTKLIQVLKRYTEIDAEDKVIGYILVEQKIDLSNKTISKYTLSEVSKFTVEKSLKMKNASSLCKAYTKISSRGKSNSDYETLEELRLPKFGSKQDRENRSLKVCHTCRKVNCECN